MQESMHIFINQGLRDHKAAPLNILEYGFGTGLNMFLTATHSAGRFINYKSLELHPVHEELLNKMMKNLVYSMKYIVQVGICGIS